MPVRDALNRLVTQRALELLPNRSVRVPIMTRKKFEELTDVRCYLESQMAKRATSLIGKEDVLALDHINSLMKVAAKRHSIEEFLHLNFDFHFQLYLHADSEITLSLAETLWLQAGPFLNEYIQSTGFDIAVKHHDSVI